MSHPDDYEQFKGHIARYAYESSQARLQVALYLSWALTLGLLLLSLLLLGDIRFNPISAWAYLMAPFALLFTGVYVYRAVRTRKRKRKNSE